MSVHRPPSLPCSPRFAHAKIKPEQCPLPHAQNPYRYATPPIAASPRPALCVTRAARNPPSPPCVFANSRFDRADPEELSTPAPIPRRAANGVEWLPVPGWDLPWLWAGFSTRKGGLSRAYCAEERTGRAQSWLHRSRQPRDRHTPTAASWPKPSRPIAKTPLIALRQFHSNRIVRTVRADAARSHPRKADGTNHR